MQREVSGFKTRLMSLYKTHIELISALPDYEEPKEEEEAVEAETPVEETPVAEEVAQAEEAPVEEVVVEETVDEEPEVLSFTPKAMPVNEEVEEEEPTTKASKFGPLKFGEDYDIKRDGQYSRKKR